MIKLKFSYIADAVFIFAFTLLTAFAVSRYYIGNFSLSLLCAISVSITVTSLYLLRATGKTKIFKIKKSEEELLLKILNQLALYKKEELLSYFCKFLTAYSVPFEKINGGFLLKNKNDFIFPYFGFENISLKEVAEAYKLTPKGKNLVLFGNSFDDKAKTFASGFGKRITLTDGSSFYLMMKEKDCFPKITDEIIKTKPKIHSLLKSTFSKTRARQCAFYGVALLILSNFVFYPVYYIISGSLFLIYAVTVRFFGLSAEGKKYDFNT